MNRGKRSPGDPMPNGIRQDARWRNSHPLRPAEEMVTQFLASPNEESWRRFRKAYIALLQERFRENRTPFDRLAELARTNDVFIGCSCPTKKNPIVGRGHTYPALEFMQKKFPPLKIVVPG